MMRQRPLLLLFVAFVLSFPAAADDISKITPKGYVTDLAGVIPAATQQRLEALGTELEQKTGAQMAIVTVQSLDDRPVEDYAVDLFKHLGVGAKKDSTGVLLLVAPNDRKYRIEVGYGLEPIINDARAGDAGRAMVPFLRQNDYGSAIEIAAWQLAKFVADDKGVTLSATPPARPAPVARRRGGTQISVFWIIFLVFILISFLQSAARGASTVRGGSGCMNGCWWILPLFLNSGGRGGNWSGGGSWGGGGFGGGSGGGGGFGGFGGGSSGGGGASGSW